MSKINISKPNCCKICDRYLTTNEKYAGHRCLNPSHWVAAGALAPTDFYLIARVAAQKSTERLGRITLDVPAGRQVAYAAVAGQPPAQLPVGLNRIVF